MSDETYQGARSRLEEILDEVNREDISLDDALSLYEEAVRLSLAACDLSESDLGLAADEPGRASADPEAPAAGEQAEGKPEGGTAFKSDAVPSGIPAGSAAGGSF